MKCEEERQKSQQQEIQELNWNRKKEQTEFGEKLKMLEETWVSSVGKMFDIGLSFMVCTSIFPVEHPTIICHHRLTPSLDSVFPSF